MKEKERIIELVRKNIITMDEALNLLEAAGEAEIQAEFEESFEKDNKKEESGSIDTNPFVEEYQKAQEEINQASQDDTDFELDEVQKEIDQLSKELKETQDNLTITRQRIRELEVLAELDDLTPKLQAQKEELEAQEKEEAKKIEKISHSIYVRQEYIDAHTAENEESFEDFIENQARDLGRKAEEFGRTAAKEGRKIGGQVKGFGKNVVREGRRLGEYVRDRAKNFVDNFTMKDVELNVSVPWVKEESLDYELVFEPAEAEKVERFDFSTSNGNLEIKTHPEREIRLKCKFYFYGSHEELSADYFLENNLIAIEDNALKIYEKSRNFGLDVEIFLPEKHYHDFSMYSIDGNIKIDKLKCKNIKIKTTNGDLKFDEVHADDLDIDLVNGNIDIKKAKIKRIDVKNINGDFRIVGDVSGIQVDAINGDIYVTKEDNKACDAILKTVNGDVKVSAPGKMNYKAYAKVGHGEIKSRVNNLTYLNDQNEKKIQLERKTEPKEKTVRLDLATNIGDIYLKDR